MLPKLLWIQYKMPHFILKGKYNVGFFSHLCESLKEQNVYSKYLKAVFEKNNWNCKKKALFVRKWFQRKQ